jgi:hypothetical protein
MSAPPVQLPSTLAGWAYFSTMAMAAALFGGVVLWALHKWHPLGRIGLGL